MLSRFVFLLLLFLVSCEQKNSSTDFISVGTFNIA